MDLVGQRRIAGQRGRHQPAESAVDSCGVINHLPLLGCVDIELLPHLRLALSCAKSTFLEPSPRATTMSRDAPKHPSQGKQQPSAQLQDANRRLDRDAADFHWLSRIYREAPIGLCCFDTQLRYLDINHWLADLNGLSVEEHLGRSVSELFPKLAEGIELQLRHVIETGEPILAGSVLAETPARPNEIRYFQHNYVAVRSDDGTIVGVSCAVEDITARRRAEQELRQHQEELAHVARLNTMGEMATGLAHEINQPLTAITSFCSVGERALDETETIDAELFRELFQEMKTQAFRASEIIRRLRELVDKRTPVRSRVDVVEPIREVLHLLDSDLRQRDVRVEQTTEPSIPAVWIDRIQIQQVLVNLILNAVDAMSETPRKQRSLEITASRKDDNSIEVSVRDTGKGVFIDSDDQVFDAFFSTKHEGMGMGLAISRTIIESHRGRLWWTPNSDRGATFHFTLPIAE